MLHLRETDFIPAQKPLRRGNVFAGGSKRRIFSADEKARIVAESYENGASVCSVARRHRLMAAQVFAWRKNARLRQQEEKFAETERLAQEVTPPSLELEFSDMAIDERQAAATPTAPIEIMIGAMTVRVPQGFDAATLKAVLQALKPPC